MKGFKYIGFFILVLLYIIIVSGFISEKRKNLTCKELSVKIEYNQKSVFLNRQDIIDMINKKVNFKGKQLKEIDLKAIENTLIKHRSIESAETYMTEDGKLNVLVSFRLPVLRVNNRSNRGYYLDSKGNIIPLSGGSSPHVIFANGYINEPFDLQKTTNIYRNEAGIPFKRSTIHDLLEITEYINSHSFWKYQIEQIYVNDRQELELIPRIGAHIILFGSVENYEEKFNNLKILYTEAFNKTGWNDYTLINLKYKDQIICTKK